MSCVGQNQNAAVAWRNRVELVRNHDCSGVSADPRDRPDRLAGLRINRVNDARLADRHVNSAGGAIEESLHRGASNGPDVRNQSRGAVDLDQIAVIAGGVKPTAGMIDV